MEKRKRHSSGFKAQVALEAIQNQRTIAQIASEYKVHPSQVTKWKRRLKEELPQSFADNGKKRDTSSEQLVDELYRQIGQLKVELDWLEKKTSLLR